MAENAETNVLMDVHPKFPKWIPAQFRNGWNISRKINETFSKNLTLSQTHELFSVEGHITQRQCAVLFYYAYTSPLNGRIVEIGSFKGKSTACMAMALKLSNKKEKVAAIDPHINTGDNLVVPNYDDRSSFDDFMNNISDLGLTDWVEPIKSTSESAVENWDQPIRLLFIDGSHRYEDVLLDLRLWESWVVPSGIIVMHDTKSKEYNEGVCRAMNEYLTGNIRFKESIRLLNMTVFTKLPSN